MNRENRYIIEVLFKSKVKTRVLYNGAIPYYGSLSFNDRISISTDKISIEANRSAIVPLDDIFYNHFSSLYNQLVKTLLYYYATRKAFVKIKSISVSRARSSKVLDNKSFKDGDFNQVLSTSFKLLYTIDQARLIEMFKETPKGQAVLISVSYILKANSGLTESDKFEKLWKAFNKLFIQIGNAKKDFDCLRNLKQFITNNPNILIQSTRKVTAFSTNRLRNVIRWRAMLLDNYDTEAKINGFRDFVLRYNDKRIMEILLETKYGYRETFLRNNNLFTQVDNHIQNTIAIGGNIDDEVVTLLTGKYMYFVRNKTFHGEKIDPSFRLSVNKEDNELKFLNGLMEAYLIDLINANNLY